MIKILFYLEKKIKKLILNISFHFKRIEHLAKEKLKLKQ